LPAVEVVFLVHTYIKYANLNKKAGKWNIFGTFPGCQKKFHYHILKRLKAFPRRNNGCDKPDRETLKWGSRKSDSDIGQHATGKSVCC
jgi:hypothetical protein